MSWIKLTKFSFEAIFSLTFKEVRSENLECGDLILIRVKIQESLILTEKGTSNPKNIVQLQNKKHHRIYYENSIAHIYRYVSVGGWIHMYPFNVSQIPIFFIHNI